MMTGNEPGSSTGNLAASNCRYFNAGQGEATGLSSGLLPGWRLRRQFLVWCGSGACLTGRALPAGERYQASAEEAMRGGFRMAKRRPGRLV